MTRFSDSDRAKRGLSRRRFLAQATMAAAAAPYVIPSSALGRDGAVAPSERVTLASIGLGIRGTDHFKTFLPLPQAQILAVSDLFDSRRERSVELAKAQYGGKGCDAYRDAREMLARDDIEAIVVASPENWHALNSIAAIRAGKDVYCEKALTRTIAEGRAVCKTARRFGRVFQAGTQQRSMRNFRFACELARNGYLGKLHTVKVGVPGGHALANAPSKEPPKELDYDTWLGPAPWKPYNDIRCTSPEGWYHMTDYCAGWIQSWGVHHVDIALWGAPSLAQGAIEVTGTAEFPTEGQGDTSVKWKTKIVASDGLVLSFCDNTQPDHPQGIRFEGDKGWVFVNRGGISAGPDTLLRANIKPNEEHLYESNNHHINFLECIRSRRDPAAPVEACHASTTMTLVADIATRLGGELKWDWEKESFVGNEAANRMRSRPMRSPWTI